MKINRFSGEMSLRTGEARFTCLTARPGQVFFTVKSAVSPNLTTTTAVELSRLPDPETASQPDRHVLDHVLCAGRRRAAFPRCSFVWRPWQPAGLDSPPAVRSRCRLSTGQCVNRAAVSVSRSRLRRPTSPCLLRLEPVSSEAETRVS